MGIKCLQDSSHLESNLLVIVWQLISEPDATSMQHHAPPIADTLSLGLNMLDLLQPETKWKNHLKLSMAIKTFYKLSIC